MFLFNSLALIKKTQKHLTRCGEVLSQKDKEMVDLLLLYESLDALSDELWSAYRCNFFLTHRLWQSWKAIDRLRGAIFYLIIRSDKINL